MNIVTACHFQSVGCPWRTRIRNKFRKNSLLKFFGFGGTDIPVCATEAIIKHYTGKMSAVLNLFHQRKV